MTPDSCREHMTLNNNLPRFRSPPLILHWEEDSSPGLRRRAAGRRRQCAGLSAGSPDGGRATRKRLEPRRRPVGGHTQRAAFPVPARQRLVAGDDVLAGGCGAELARGRAELVVVPVDGDRQAERGVGDEVVGRVVDTKDPGRGEGGTAAAWLGMQSVDR